MSDGKIISEQQTTDLRQVKKVIKRNNGVMGPGGYEYITGYDVTIQRRWVLTIETNGSDYGGYNEVHYRDEWRDLPTVTDPKAP